MGATLYQRYHKDILRWDWNDIVESAKSEPQEDYEGNTYGYQFLGTVFALSPSGKYYTPWANSNVTEREAYRDEQFYFALDDVASDKGGWIESGEGDPCDIFFVIALDNE